MSFRIFHPILAGARPLDRIVTCIGATICIALTMFVSSGLELTASDLPLIVAPMGASAVLIFAVPASPLAQPWPVVGGNTVSALVGIAVYRHVADPMVAAGLAVGLAIFAMSLCRCLHPPGGAAALTAVIGGDSVHAAGYAFALAPVALNSAALVMLAMVFHRLSPHSYPHRAVPVVMPPAASGLHLEDIDHALAELPDSFDISRADLDVLLSLAETHAQARRGR
ncbi:HPP family protein [Sphingomonas sp.]|jgi:CBS domain-containing membrane protein|uniref:HPP family protein n=1 Tax=Sphingomonas sp. TaxID=28214 RepID=UPI002E1232DF|nr:HPP family protein [Sphingomonas sp.]